VPSTPPPPLPPTGRANITVLPNSLNFPAFGGILTLTLSNTGSGVGSWRVTPEDPARTGISVSPSSGFLLPGSSVSVQVFYNGNGPNEDFATTLTVQATGALTTIAVVVG
jgi:hypothetical protein